MELTFSWHLQTDKKKSLMKRPINDKNWFKLWFFPSAHGILRGILVDIIDLFYTKEQNTPSRP